MRSIEGLLYSRAQSIGQDVASSCQEALTGNSSRFDQSQDNIGINDQRFPPDSGARIR